MLKQMMRIFLLFVFYYEHLTKLYMVAPVGKTIRWVCYLWNFGEPRYVYDTMNTNVGYLFQY